MATGERFISTASLAIATSSPGASGELANRADVNFSRENHAKNSRNPSRAPDCMKNGGNPVEKSELVQSSTKLQEIGQKLSGNRSGNSENNICGTFHGDLDPLIHGSSSPREAEPRPSPASSRAHPSPSFYRNGAQPIHPVLQRRNTPLRVPQGARRATQPVPTNFQYQSAPVAFIQEHENLSCDKTGRLPIPPPRTPGRRVAAATVTRNVSQNGLRSPKLSPKPPRARGGAMDVSPGARYENTSALDAWVGIRTRNMPTNPAAAQSPIRVTDRHNVSSTKSNLQVVKRHLSVT